MRFLLYGAYGYTGRLIVAEAVRQGWQPVLAGRDGQRLQALA
ncbi:MAG TPA: saccharopine dehydrogenase, partial [Anaerolineales bacterium]|nr:saccharopine dehydrogenase [Anaerolineales bacterium]